MSELPLLAVFAFAGDLVDQACGEQRSPLHALQRVCWSLGTNGKPCDSNTPETELSFLKPLLTPSYTSAFVFGVECVWTLQKFLAALGLESPATRGRKP